MILSSNKNVQIYFFREKDGHDLPHGKLTKIRLDVEDIPKTFGIRKEIIEHPQFSNGVSPLNPTNYREEIIYTIKLDKIFLKFDDGIIAEKYFDALCNPKIDIKQQYPELFL